MICPLTENFKAVISRACIMLNEIGMHNTVKVLMFFACLDYSDRNNAMEKVNKYLHTLGRYRKGEVKEINNANPRKK
jgi:hypothetical protein